MRLHAFVCTTAPASHVEGVAGISVRNASEGWTVRIVAGEGGAPPSPVEPTLWGGIGGRVLRPLPFGR